MEIENQHNVKATCSPFFSLPTTRSWVQVLAFSYPPVQPLYHLYPPLHKTSLLPLNSSWVKTALCWRGYLALPNEMPYSSSLPDIFHDPSRSNPSNTSKEKSSSLTAQQKSACLLSSHCTWNNSTVAIYYSTVQPTGLFCKTESP
jgi:hypothetical protein